MFHSRRVSVFHGILLKRSLHSNASSASFDTSKKLGPLAKRKMSDTFWKKIIVARYTTALSLRSYRVFSTLPRNGSSNNTPSCPKCKKRMKHRSEDETGRVGAMVNCDCSPSVLYLTETLSKAKSNHVGWSLSPDVPANDLKSRVAETVLHDDIRVTSRPLEEGRHVLLDSEDGKNRFKKPVSNAFLTPRMVYESLGQYVIGQEKVKKVLSVAVHNHYNILAFNQTHNSTKHYDSKGNSYSLSVEEKTEADLLNQVNNGWFSPNYSGFGSYPNLIDRSHFPSNPESWAANRKPNRNVEGDHDPPVSSQQDFPSSMTDGKTIPVNTDHNSETSSFNHRQGPPRTKSGYQVNDTPVNSGFVSALGEFERRKELMMQLKAKFKSSASFADVAQLDKSNILIVGPTGSGKTLMAKTLAKMAGVPLAISDATTLTQAGYIGEDVESVLYKLYQEADYDLELTQRGIVYIDEIDKISKAGGSGSGTGSRDVSGEGVQQALLKILEGTIANVPKKGSDKNMKKEYVQIDTTNILFICGGAFAGLERVIANRLNKTSIGFGANVNRIHFERTSTSDETSTSFNSSNTDLMLQQVEATDLVTYGLIPEFVGRFSQVLATQQLTVKDLMLVLTKPKNALIKQYKTLFLLESINLIFTEDAITTTAKLAYNRGTGARGLRAVLDKCLMDTMFILPEKVQEGVRCVVVDGACVLGEASPYFVKELVNEQDLKDFNNNTSIEAEHEEERVGIAL